MAEFFTSVFFVRMVTSFICSAAFVLLFKAAPRHLLPAGLAGMLTYFVYYLVLFLGGHVFAAALFSTAAGAVFSEIYARMHRAPVIVTLCGAIIPIVPGGDLYYTMQHALASNGAMSLEYLWRTLSIALGMAGGIVVVALVFRIACDKIAELRLKRN